jgi:hypothetical protein
MLISVSRGVVWIFRSPYIMHQITELNNEKAQSVEQLLRPCLPKEIFKMLLQWYAVAVEVVSRGDMARQEQLRSYQE